MNKINRILALDTFRGATIALMIIVNNPGTWSHVYGPLRHAHWHGCTLTDLVFPFFLVLAAVVILFYSLVAKSAIKTPLIINE